MSELREGKVKKLKYIIDNLIYNKNNRKCENSLPSANL